MSTTCIEQWQTSYQASDLADRQALIEAMAYSHYVKSTEDIRGQIDGVVDGQDCVKMPRNGVRVQPNHACCGEVSDLQGQVAYLFLGKPLFPLPSTVGATQPPEFLTDALIQSTRRLILFVSDWVDTNGYDLLGPPDEVDCAALVTALGLCGTQWSINEQVTILRLSVQQAHVPTWLDAGLTFFWCSVEPGAESGMSRSLETGLISIREWVVPKEVGAFQVEEYWNSRFARDCSLLIDDLCDVFWDGCAQNLEQERLSTADNGGV